MKIWTQYRGIYDLLQAEKSVGADHLGLRHIRSEDQLKLKQLQTHELCAWNLSSNHSAQRKTVPREESENNRLSSDTAANQTQTLFNVDIESAVGEKSQDTAAWVVTWSDEDASNPREWTLAQRLIYTLIISAIAFVCTVSSTIDAAVARQAAETFGVSDVVESLAIGMFLFGCAAGSLFMGPFSETFGRGSIYIGGMVAFMIWVLASALSPNISAQLIFRFLAGMFSCVPLTCAGGSMSDLWTPTEKTWTFVIYAIPAYAGPIFGPVIGSYMYTNGIPSWRWTEWITLITAALVLLLTLLILPETHPGIIQMWKAKHLRTLTDDDHFKSSMETEGNSLRTNMMRSLKRPFVLAVEPIVLSITLWLALAYAIIFLFLDGYIAIFEHTYKISQGLTNIIFVALFVGTLITAPFTWLVWRWTRSEMIRDGLDAPRPESRLWMAMLAGPWAMSASLFWLAWTSTPTISIWSPILATGLFGLGLLGSFLSAILYLIDAYETNVASALTFATVIRYIIAGGMSVAGVPFFNKVNHQWVCTVLGFVSLLCVPIPYVLYYWGPTVRKRSKNCLNKT